MSSFVILQVTTLFVHDGDCQEMLSFDNRYETSRLFGIMLTLCIAILKFKKCNKIVTVTKVMWLHKSSQ